MVPNLKLVNSKCSFFLVKKKGSIKCSYYLFVG